jgi:hypothetical protein
MDDRQTQIKEGAGLEDSRVNQEFVDFLNKWSSPVLLTLAVAALIWAGLQYLERQKIARIDQAFSELAAATQGGNPSPASLKTLASEYSGVRAVPELALLTTSDLYLNAFVTGIEPGAERDQQTGLIVNESDNLDEAQRAAYLEQAGQLAQQVLDLASKSQSRELIVMQAMTRLAVVEEGKRNFEAAASMYTRLESFATESGFVAVGNFANARVSKLEEIKDLTPLISESELQPLPGQLPSFTQEQLQEMIDNIQNEDSLLPVDTDAIPSEDLVVPETGSDPATESEDSSVTEEPADPQTQQPPL